MFKSFISLFILLLSYNCVAETPFPKVSEHWLRAAPPNSMMQAAYLQLENDSTSSRNLIGAFSPDFRMAEIHKTLEVDGLTKMQHQPEIMIDRNQTLSFSPGGLHIMLMQPKRQLVEGDEVKICLIYENGDVQHINFPVLKK